MNTGIELKGASLESAKAVAAVVTAIFDSAFKNYMEQETVRTAIKAATAALGANNNVISGCSFGDKSL